MFPDISFRDEGFVGFKGRALHGFCLRLSQFVEFNRYLCLSQCLCLFTCILFDEPVFTCTLALGLNYLFFGADFFRSRNFCFGVYLSCGYVCVLASDRVAVSVFVCVDVCVNFFMKRDRVSRLLYILFVFADDRVRLYNLCSCLLSCVSLCVCTSIR